MRVAVIGLGNINVNIDKYIPEKITELVTSCLCKVELLASEYADKNNIPKLILKPEYKKYGKSAVFHNDKTIVEISDIIVAIIDKYSNDTSLYIHTLKQLASSSQKELILYTI